MKISEISDRAVMISEIAAFLDNPNHADTEEGITTYLYMDVIGGLDFNIDIHPYECGADPVVNIFADGERKYIYEGTMQSKDLKKVFTILAENIADRLIMARLHVTQAEDFFQTPF